MTRKKVRVVAGVWLHEARVLVTQRKIGTHLEGLWEFPGGKVEPGESDAAALTRELMEEIGASVSVGEALNQVSFDYPEKTVEIAFYLVTGDPRQIRALDVAAMEWRSAHELDARDFPPADVEVLNVIRARIAAWDHGFSYTGES